jgi:hypothetical protein
MSPVSTALIKHPTRTLALLKRLMYAEARINYRIQCQFRDQLPDGFARPFGGLNTGGVEIIIYLPERMPCPI